MNTGKRPFVIWLSIAYIAIGLILNLLVLYRISDYLLRSETINIVSFILNLALCGLLILAFDGIQRRSSWGQRLAILSFSLLGVFAIFNAVTLFQWPQTGSGTNDLLFAKILVLGRVCLSFFLAVVFGVSRTVDKYFAEGKEPGPSEPRDGNHEQD